MQVFQFAVQSLVSLTYFVDTRNGHLATQVSLHY